MAEIIESTVDGKYQLYDGRPLVREGNRIVYGDLSDPYTLLIMILTNKTVMIGTKEESVPDNVIVQVLKTDPKLSPMDRLEKTFQCKGLADALKTGIIYMDRMNKK
jgi:hypothetical protein